MRRATHARATWWIVFHGAALPIVAATPTLYCVSRERNNAWRFLQVTFDPASGYTRVLLQQGRMLLDADFSRAHSMSTPCEWDTKP